MMGQLGETRDVANGNGDVKANIVLNDYFGEKSGDLRNGFCSKKCVNKKCNTRISLLESLESELEETPKIANGNGDFKASNEEYGDDSDEQECHEEDEEVDVMALRKLVRIERQRANAAYLELEKERLAAATAAEEAMAMILKLQNDKSLIEMEANQYRRLTEEKQLRDQEELSIAHQDNRPQNVYHNLFTNSLKDPGGKRDKHRSRKQRQGFAMKASSDKIEDLPLESAPAVVSASTLASLAALDSVPESAAYSLELDSKYSNVGKFFKGKASHSSNLPSQDEIGALIDELVMNTKTLIKATST
ncbi:hypothetical protein HYC85_024277 [Camellia sinensis]|uniref:GTD-binding domain-containing protein n=1 Tax=Camellia sinensis TaxID=4442 RepID=A0A7J7GA04_CAMSI|nr:hypothetical protein HYC85_024277 [Camellia sinensis]